VANFQTRRWRFHRSFGDSMNIGDLIGGSLVQGILFADSLNKLAQDPNFLFTPGAANGINFAGSAANSPVTISAAGSDADIRTEIRSKGLGDIYLSSTPATNSLVYTANAPFGALVSVGSGNDVAGGGLTLIEDIAALSGPYLQFIHAQGTLAAPTGVLTGDGLGQIRFAAAYDNTGIYYNGAVIVGAATQNWSAATAGAEIRFLTEDNLGGNLTTRLVINQNGNVSFTNSGTQSAASPATAPALKGGGAGATLAVRTADDSADAPFSAKSGTFSDVAGTPSTFATLTAGGKIAAGAASGVKSCVQ